MLLLNTTLWVVTLESFSCTHIADLKVLSHEEVEGGAGVGPDGTYAAAAAPQQSQTQVSTLLRFLLEQQFRKLHRQKEKHKLTKYNIGMKPWRKW